MSSSMIRGEGKRNPRIVVTLLNFKLEDAEMMVERQRKQFLREKVSLCMTINRHGVIKE